MKKMVGTVCALTSVCLFFVPAAVFGFVWALVARGFDWGVREEQAYSIWVGEAMEDRE